MLLTRYLILVLLKEQIDTGKTVFRDTRKSDDGRDNILSVVREETGRFNRSFGFDIRPLYEKLSLIDDAIPQDSPMFILIRYDALMAKRRYCLFTIFREGALHGNIGIYQKGCIKTLKPLKPLTDMKNIRDILYDWLRQLLLVSCEKVTL